MRTTITLDDDTARLLHEQVRRRGVTFKQAVNDAVRAGLALGGDDAGFSTPQYDMGLPSVPLERALALAAELEDDELVREMAQRR